MDVSGCVRHMNVYIICLWVSAKAAASQRSEKIGSTHATEGIPQIAVDTDQHVTVLGLGQLHHNYQLEIMQQFKCLLSQMVDADPTQMSSDNGYQHYGCIPDVTGNCNYFPFRVHSLDLTWVCSRTIWRSPTIKLVMSISLWSSLRNSSKTAKFNV